MEKRIQLPETKDGDTFNLAGYEFIKFPSLNNETPRIYVGCVICSLTARRGRESHWEIRSTKDLPCCIWTVWTN